MQKKIFSILILLVPLIGISQMNSSFDFITGIDYSYRNLSANSEERDVSDLIEYRNNRESAKSNWRIGFNLNKRLDKKLYLKTGIRLASVGYSLIKTSELRWPSEHDGMGGLMQDPSLPDELEILRDYFFIEVPFVLRYEWSLGKLTPFIETGLAPSAYATTKTKTITEQGSEINYRSNSDQTFNNLQFVGIFSIGLNYSINDRYQLFGQPTFRYHLTQSHEAPIREHLFSYGLEIGVRRKIK